LNAGLADFKLDVTIGVDLVNGVPTFFVDEGSKMSIGGLEITGSVNSNLGIRNLLDVDVAGEIEGKLHR